MKKSLLLFLLLLGASTYAQKFDLGKVTVQELSEKVCPIDSSAPAAVLFSIGKTSFNYSSDDGFRIVTEIITKIKIYKKEGYEYANHKEHYFIGGNSGAEQVAYSKAATYNLVNGKVEKTKLSSEGEFKEELNKSWAVRKITMPNVKEGSIVEFKITITSKYIQNFPEWEFQQDIPVMYSEYSTYIPEYFIYNRHFKGYQSPKVVNNAVDRNIDYYFQSAATGPRSNTSNNATVKEVIDTYSMVEVPALKEEPYTNNIDNYRSTIIHEIAGTRYPNQPFKNFTTDWETVAKGIYASDNFGAELNKSGYYEKDVETLLAGVTDPIEKVALLFNFVKSRMTWNEHVGLYCKDGVKKAFQAQNGNVAEINLMLVSMLRFVGMNANPVILSTRNNGISLFPSESAFNYVIAAVVFQDQLYLLDATDKLTLPNILPIRALNWNGRMIQKDGTNTLIDLMPTGVSKDVVSLMATVESSGKVTGKIKEMYFDYDAMRFRSNYGGFTKESQIERLEKNHKGIEIVNYDVQNVKDLGQPVSEYIDFEDNSSVEVVGTKLLFNPLLFLAITENPFKQEKREYPVDFLYPNQNRYNVFIKIPEGYVVESLPQNKALAMPDNVASFKMSLTQNEGQIQIMFSFDVNEAVIGAEDYVVLKGLLAELVKKQTEKIILKKA